MSAAGFTRDPFLSNILGKPAFRVQAGAALPDDLFRSGPESFAFARIGADRPGEAYDLQGAGFRLVDTNVQLDRSRGASWETGELVPSYRLREAEEKDRSGVEQIAASAFVFTRFHLDPEIPEDRASEIKRLWAANFFEGRRGDAMIVALHDDLLAGFLQLLVSGGDLVIDLIAVGAPHQGKGLASAMIRFAADRFSSCDRILVGTQVANVPSLRLYEKLGFRVCGASYLFHYHGPLNFGG